LIFVRHRLRDVMQATMAIAANRRQVLGAFVIDAPIIIMMDLGRAIAAANAVPSDFALETRCGFRAISFQLPIVGSQIFMIPLLSVGHDRSSNSRGSL
jgi:uncharacterized ferredoxin-like protein